MTLTMAATLFPMTSLADTKEGWVQNSEGKWSYYEDDAKVKCDSRFDESDYKYYVLDSKGYRYTKLGLYTASYFYTYYGDKVKYKRSFYVQSDGSLLRFSWKKIDGKWYYFNYDGMMEKGMVRSKEDTKTGEYKFYLLGSDGARTTKKGWTTLKYHYAEYGDKLKESQRYYLGEGGEAKYEGWKKIKVSSKSSNYGGTYTYKSTQWVYVTKDGSLQTGLKKISGTYYYFTPSMQTVTTYDKVSKNGDYYTRYYFGRDGKCKRTKKIYYAT